VKNGTKVSWKELHALSTCGSKNYQEEILSYDRRIGNPFVRISVYLIRGPSGMGVWEKILQQAASHSLQVYPSCSNYTIMALEQYGFLRGGTWPATGFGDCKQGNTESCVDYP